MNPHAPKVFFGEDLPASKRAAMHQRFAELFPGRFASVEDASIYLGRLIVPQSRRWIYVANNKTGTTTTKRLLFELEFGTPLTVALDASDDINSDAVPQKLQTSGIFRSLQTLPLDQKAFEFALKLTTVRNPVSRTLSAFQYFCKTQEERHPWMLNDRLRINAMVGFDWQEDARTAGGFVKFLRFIDRVNTEAGERFVNPHWKSQFDLIRPDVAQPDLIGRCENLGPFFQELADRLGRPLPAHYANIRANRQTDKADPRALMSPEAERLLGHLFRKDFEWLGYQPDEWKKAEAPAPAPKDTPRAGAWPAWLGGRK